MKAARSPVLVICGKHVSRKRRIDRNTDKVRNGRHENTYTTKYE